MNEATAKRLAEIAPLIEKFLDLHPDEQAWLLPLLGKAEKTAITVISEIEGHALTYQEIAKFTDINPQTVQQILYALELGGIAFKQGKSGKWISPKGGRKRKLLKMD
jgi:predicted Rossmann fold nucleotide-binding protein DprA/Smf involved in DNA uptake